MDGAYYLVFGIAEYSSLLKNAKPWYTDATFSVVQKSFGQLFGIHVFVKEDEGNIKQVLLAFTIMSRKRKKDYRTVLKLS